MSKRQDVEMVAKALTFLTEKELEKDNQKNNKWEVETTKQSVDCLIKSLDFFFENKTRQIYLGSTKGFANFNVPTLIALDLSKFYDTPLDFVNTLRISVINYLMDEETSEHSKDSSSNRLEPPLT